jgi:hypothetical protein
MLLAPVHTDDYGGYLSPTLAAVCQCYGEACQCGDNCDCWPKETKPVISVVNHIADVSKKVDRRPLRIDDRSPITLAPDPDYHSALADFQARHLNGVSKVYVGSKLPPETPAALSSGTKRPPAKVSQQPPAKYIPPIEKAAMVQQLVCVNGTCSYQWVPASQAPTQRTYQRRGLFRRW